MKTTIHRLDGLEPDNLLGFLCLLGLLRCLDIQAPKWTPRVSWSVKNPPVRPVIQVRGDVGKEEIVTETMSGLNRLAGEHQFPDKNLKLLPEEAREQLFMARTRGHYGASLWASLVSDKARKRGQETVEPTPLCLMFGQGHQYFLARMASVPQQRTTASKAAVKRVGEPEAEANHICRALFAGWQRKDNSDSFRWDPAEDVRYAYRPGNPTVAKYKQRTEHGANRLAAVGLASLTVFPKRAGRDIRLGVRGGSWPPRRFSLCWPIWRSPMSLAAIEGLLDHPRLGDPSVQRALGVVELRRAQRESVGRYMNFTYAQRVEAE